MNTPNGYPEINAMFGNPSNADGSLNISWQHANIVLVTPPTAWKLYYQNSATSIIPIAGISMHRLLRDNFLTVLNDIWNYANSQIGGTPNTVTVQNWIHERRLDITGGGFNFRPSTGTPSKLSLHAYGIAIDWDPVHNPHAKPLSRTLPDWWYSIWASNGWTDGRPFQTPDPMHVQFATGA